MEDHDLLGFFDFGISALGSGKWDPEQFQENPGWWNLIPFGQTRYEDQPCDSEKVTVDSCLLKSAMKLSRFFDLEVGRRWNLLLQWWEQQGWQPGVGDGPMLSIWCNSYLDKVIPETAVIVNFKATENEPSYSYATYIDYKWLRCVSVLKIRSFPPVNTPSQ